MKKKLCSIATLSAAAASTASGFTYIDTPQTLYGWDFWFLDSGQNVEGGLFTTTSFVTSSPGWTTFVTTPGGESYSTMTGSWSSSSKWASFLGSNNMSFAISGNALRNFDPANHDSVTGDLFTNGQQWFSVTWLSAVAPDMDNFESGSAYLAFKFDIGEGVQYGWSEVSYDLSGGVSLTFEEWAYGDVGESITVGQTTAVPEPEKMAMGLGLLALGAAGMRRYRKARKR